MNEVQNLIYYGWLYRVPIQTVMLELAAVHAHVSKLEVLEIWLTYDQAGKHSMPVAPVFQGLPASAG